MTRAPRLLAVFLSAVAVLASTLAPAEAAVVCQRRNKVKLRPEACKAKEVTIADLGGDLSGVWRHREGNGLSQSPFVPAFLTLGADGTGSLNLREPTSQVLSCRSLRYARGGGTPTLTVRGLSFGVDVVQAALEGTTVLRITDDAGTSVFDRVEAVDPTAECGTLTEISRLTNVAAPSSASIGLAFDGTSLIYLNEDSDPVIVDATTGAEDPPPTLAGLGRIPFAAEGADLWGLCGCGGNDVAVRSSRSGNEVDSVETTALLGSSTSIQALAVPAAGRLLVLTSEGRGRFQGRLLLVDTAAEPDALLSEVDFDVFLASMGHDGATLWGLQGIGGGALVVRVDPTTGRATGTFRIPDATVDWRALAAGGGRIFLVGIAGDGSGVIATFGAP